MACEWVGRCISIFIDVWKKYDSHKIHTTTFQPIALSHIFACPGQRVKLVGFPDESGYNKDRLQGNRL